MTAAATAATNRDKARVVFVPRDEADLFVLENEFEVGDLLVLDTTPRSRTLLWGYDLEFRIGALIPLRETLKHMNALAYFSDAIRVFWTISGSTEIVVSPNDLGIQHLLAVVDWRWYCVALRYSGLPLPTYCVQPVRGVFVTITPTERRRGITAVGAVARLSNVQYGLVVISPVELDARVFRTCTKRKVHTTRPDKVAAALGVAIRTEHHLLGEPIMYEVTGERAALRYLKREIESVYRHTDVVPLPPDHALSFSRDSVTLAPVENAKARRPHQKSAWTSLAMIFAEMPLYVVVEIAEWLPGASYWTYGEIAAVVKRTREAMTEVAERRAERVACARIESPLADAEINTNEHG